ncbi:alpha/beta fold hydrolase [Streptomyces sp. NPDC048650]|uniref:alpha/beta fold hydrolase n=1 Tax=unclassified Streptomyces TaxID=2593676 RepID=UPI00371D44D2
MIATARPTLLLVHGAWHGSWCWANLQAELIARGRASRTVDLPSALRTPPPPGPLPGLHDDAEAVRTAIGAIGGPVAVVAHSYGGIPVTEATAGIPQVTRLVYLAAYQLDRSENLLSFRDASEPDLDVVDGLVPPTPNPRATLYADAPPAESARAAARLVPHSARCATDRITRSGWHTIPSSYIVCDQDRTIPPAQQERMATRAKAVHHLASSHSPFLSKPGELADLLTTITV